MPATGLGKIEVILDSGARTRDLRQLVGEVQAFFREAEAITGEPVKVGYLDTPQLFHEKTGYLSPAQAPKDAAAWPEHIRGICEEMARGDYEVSASGPVEAHYAQALREYGFERELKKNGSAEFRAHGVQNPEDIDDALLQQLYQRHVVAIPKGDPSRNKPDFKEYLAVRADSGERSVADFLENRTVSEASGRVLTLFVSQDHAAKQNVRRAAAGKDPKQEAVFSLGIQEAKDLLVGLVRDYKALHPETASIDFNPTSGQANPSSHVARLARSQASSERVR